MYLVRPRHRGLCHLLVRTGAPCSISIRPTPGQRGNGQRQSPSLISPIGVRHHRRPTTVSRQHECLARGEFASSESGGIRPQAEHAQSGIRHGAIRKRLGVFFHRYMFRVGRMFLATIKTLVWFDLTICMIYPCTKGPIVYYNWDDKMKKVGIFGVL